MRTIMGLLVLPLAVEELMEESSQVLTQALENGRMIEFLR